jgi:hypothetical protein
MILKNDRLLVQIEGTIFQSSRTGTRQFVLDENALQGFHDGVNVKRDDTVRPNQWGDFREPGLFGSRHLTISGTAVATNTSELMSMRDEFMGLLNQGEYREILVQNSVGNRYITVGLEGSPSWVQKLDHIALWKLELYAPDPRMYGPPQGFQITDTTINGGIDYPMDYPLDYGGATKVQVIAMHNNGNTDSWPVFIVTGNFFKGFHITNNSGKIITYEGIVSLRDPVTIDTGSGTATQSGSDRSTMITRRDWFSIPPGGSIQPMFYPIEDSVGWCDIIYRDTWI